VHNRLAIKFQLAIINIISDPSCSIALSISCLSSSTVILHRSIRTPEIDLPNKLQQVIDVPSNTEAEEASPFPTSEEKQQHV
jgi:hypothetical protein